MSEPFPSDRITGPDYISVADARKAIMKAREEGRREGLEEAERSIILEISAIEAAYRTLAKSERLNADCAAVTSGMTAALAAIRALKEKQP